MSSLSSPSLPSEEALLRDPQYLRLKEHLVESTGLMYYADKDLDLARRIGRRLATTGRSDCASYFELLCDPLHGHRELDALIAEITIGETYFFRHQEHFDALLNHVLPELLKRNRLSRSLRIWCAGCADGAEPYSLSILLKRQMVDQLVGWDVSVIATDLNRHSLARAREGRFAEWALRATPEDLKLECFSKDGSLWTLDPIYRKGVSFQYHNLVEHPFPSLVHNLSGFDLILCRNVMIYFGPELMQRMIGQFHQCLVPGGWLLVGPAEPNLTFFKLFRSVNLPGLTLYQKSEEAGQSTTDEQFQVPELASLPVFASSSEHADCGPAPKENVDAILAQARSHADHGQWEKAEQCCEDLLATQQLNPRVYFCHGLVLEHMRKHSQSEQSLRKAIYLDRQFVLAHYYLGLVLQSRNRAHQAARCFENTLELLGNFPPDHCFPDADGITAQELGNLAATHLNILHERICQPRT